jgi:hypothetical protein
LLFFIATLIFRIALAFSCGDSIDQLVEGG